MLYIVLLLIIVIAHQNGQYLQLKKQTENQERIITRLDFLLKELSRPENRE